LSYSGTITTIGLLDTHIVQLTITLINYLVVMKLEKNMINS